MSASNASTLAPESSATAASATVEEIPWDWIDRGLDNRRKHARKSVVLPAKLRTVDGEFDCIVLDISAGGARLHVVESFDATGAVTLKFDPYGPFAARVAWRATAEIGLQFAVAPDEILRVLTDIL